MSTVSLQSVIEEARQAIETGAPDKAIGIARHILSHYPRLIEGARLLGEAYLNAGQSEEAAAAFEQVLAADPENVAAYYGLGLARQSADQPDAAIPAFERALEIQPNLAELRTQLMRLYAETSGSVGQFRLSRAGLGRLYARGGMFGQAIDEFRSVLDTAPDRDDVKVALAEALWRDGQEDEAIDFCREILSRRAELLKPTLLLGYLLFASGDPRGEELWRRAAEQDTSMTMSRTLFDILPPIRLEEPVLPSFDEAEWRAQEARRATEEAQRAAAEAQREQEQSVGVAAAPVTTHAVEEEDFFADSWLSSSNLSQTPAWNEPEPISAAPAEPVAEADDDDALLAALLGFGDDESDPAAQPDDVPTGVQPFSLDDTDVSTPTGDEALALDDIGLAEDDDMVSGDIKPFSLDDWDEEELPSASLGAADVGDESLELGDIQPFSLDDDSSLGDVQPFQLDESDVEAQDDRLQVADQPDQFDLAAPAIGAGESSLDLDTGEEGLGDVRPFSLEDWGLEDDAEIAPAVESSTEGEADSDLAGLQPFSLDDLALESLDSESTSNLPALEDQALADTVEERKDFQWEEPSWRKQAREQAEAAPTIEGESIFERMRNTQEQDPPAGSEHDPEGEAADFFSMDEESLRVDWNQPQESSANPELSASDLDVLNEAIGLGGASADQPVSLGAPEASEDDLPDLEGLLNEPAGLDAATEQTSHEETMPFSLADLGLDEDDQTLFSELPSGAADETTLDTALDDAFSLESLGLADDFGTLEGANTSPGDAAEDSQASTLPGTHESMGDSPEVFESAGTAEVTQDEAEISPFSLADLGFTDDEIADLGLDLSETEAGGLSESATGSAESVLPFSLEDLGLSDDELESIHEQRESPQSFLADNLEPNVMDREAPVDDGDVSTPGASDFADTETVSAGHVDQAEQVVSTSYGPGGAGDIFAQLGTDPDNDPLRLAVARMTRAMQDTNQSLEQYRQLIRRGGLLDDVIEDLQDMMIAESDDPSLQRRMHRLLGDAFMKQNRVREAMDAYSWTPARAK